MAQAADLVVVNGRVLTMDDARPRAEAVAIKGNTIAAVGTSAYIGELRGRQTRVIDANGATVLPGFIEAHLHIFPGGASLDALTLVGIHGLDRLTTVTRAFASTWMPFLAIAATLPSAGQSITLGVTEVCTASSTSRPARSIAAA